jgi:p-aminobenzoyl-glutamate transporter AbgT
MQCNRKQTQQKQTNKQKPKQTITNQKDINHAIEENTIVVVIIIIIIIADAVVPTNGR